MCFEVSLNGQVLFRAGGDQLESMFASISHKAPHDLPYFQVHGLNRPADNLFEEVYWAKQTALSGGDTLTVRVVENATPDSFVVGNYFGTRTSAGIGEDHYCTFCGQSARAVGMLVHKKANICHECLRKYQPDEM